MHSALSSEAEQVRRGQAHQVRSGQAGQAFGGGIDVEELIRLRIEEEQRIARLVEQGAGQSFRVVGVHDARRRPPLPTLPRRGGRAGWGTPLFLARQDRDQLTPCRPGKQLARSAISKPDKAIVGK